MDMHRDGERRERGVSVAIRQEETQPLTRLTVGAGALRYLFDRAHDSKATGEPGQDFLAFRHGAGRLVFAVCDGVGGSFLGHLAAQFLGTELVEWLWGSRGFQDRAELQRDVSRFLDDLVPAARGWIARYPLPDTLPPLLRAVLEERRAYGSETMFACGQVEWPSAAAGGVVALAYLGDAELQVFDRSGRQALLTGTTQERWSTHRGTRGQVRTALFPAHETVRLIAYSDGLRRLARELPGLADDDLDRAVARLGADPLSDDVSLIDLALDGRDMARGHEARAQSLAPPHFLSPPNDSVVRRGSRLTWTEVPGARSYRVQQATSPAFDPGEVLDEDVHDPWVVIQEDRPGSYCYRVRASFDGTESDWSSPLHVVVDTFGRKRDAIP